jgi:hypothetical protein
MSVFLSHNNPPLHIIFPDSQSEKRTHTSTHFYSEKERALPLGHVLHRQLVRARRHRAEPAPAPNGGWRRLNHLLPPGGLPPATRVCSGRCPTGICGGDESTWGGWDHVGEDPGRPRPVAEGGTSGEQRHGAPKNCDAVLPHPTRCLPLGPAHNVCRVLWQWCMACTWSIFSDGCCPHAHGDVYSSHLLPVAFTCMHMVMVTVHTFCK